MTEERCPDAKSTYKKLAVLWLIQPVRQASKELCPALRDFVVADPPSHRCRRTGNFVLRNRQLLIAANCSCADLLPRYIRCVFLKLFRLL